MFTAEILGSGGGGVVKLLACGATGPGFESGLGLGASISEIGISFWPEYP